MPATGSGMPVNTAGAGANNASWAMYQNSAAAGAKTGNTQMLQQVQQQQQQHQILRKVILTIEIVVI